MVLLQTPPHHRLLQQALATCRETVAMICRCAPYHLWGPLSPHPFRRAWTWCAVHAGATSTTTTSVPRELIASLRRRTQPYPTRARGPNPALLPVRLGLTGTFPRAEAWRFGAGGPCCWRQQLLAHSAPRQNVSQACHGNVRAGDYMPRH
eukprot:scaffold751_cov395-Prasinococcus_capsulatus_cf.AAC.30